MVKDNYEKYISPEVCILYMFEENEILNVSGGVIEDPSEDPIVWEW